MGAGQLTFNQGAMQLSLSGVGPGQIATLTTGGVLALRGNIQHGPNCDGELKIIAAIIEAPVIKRIHMQLGL